MVHELDKMKEFSRKNVASFSKAGMAVEDIAKFYKLSTAQVELILEMEKERIMDSPKLKQMRELGSGAKIGRMDKDDYQRNISQIDYSGW
jgi:hypothetical protein